MDAVIRAEDCDTVEQILEENDSFLFDCDGVLWGSNKIFPGVAETLIKLHQHRKKVLFVTNNSTKTRAEYLKKIQGYGVEATLNEVYCTAYTCALYLKRNLKNSGDAEVYVIGNASIGEELDKVGIKHFGIGPDNSIKSAAESSKLTEPMRKNVQAVIVGFDDYFNYAKITKAVSYLSKPGTLFLATNMDANFPAPDSEYVLPGTGSLITAVAYAAGRKPDVICGKPDSIMIDCIKAECDFDPSKAVMVGDRFDTDILFGNANGLKTFLVMSGVSNEKMLQELSQCDNVEAKKMMPNYVANSLADFADKAKAYDVVDSLRLRHWTCGCRILFADPCLVLTMKPMMTSAVADEMFPDNDISDEVAVETSSSAMQLADLTANEKMVHADFYNTFDDLFDDENLD